MERDTIWSNDKRKVKTQEALSYILGINGGFGGGYQDTAAVLLLNGKVVAAVEEERISRIKFAPGVIPLKSVSEVLNIAGITMQDVSFVAFHGSTWTGDIDIKLNRLFTHHFGCCPPVRRYHHHACHAASGYYYSEFKEALIFSMDTSGDGISSRVTLAGDNTFEILYESKRPDSFGVFYSMLTQFCGFNRDKDEYKLMGLSAYGNKNRFNFVDIISIREGHILFDTSFLVDINEGKPYPPKQEIVFSAKLNQYLGLNGFLSLNDKKDLAASAQNHLEKIVEEWIMYYIKKTGFSNVILTGGVALNCLMNQKIMKLPEVSSINIPPIAGDMGISFGAACLASLDAGIVPENVKHCYLGNSYQDAEIEKVLSICDVKYEVMDDMNEVSNMLMAGNVIAWFNGRMEYGPRALGNRSILAAPFTKDMKDTVNQKIKFRESFRPFGASVLEEDFDIYFHGKEKSSPYMTMVYNVKPDIINEISAVVHEDGTCRIQTVSRETNDDFYNLISVFKQKSGHGVLLNTSFNLDKEPIVESPRDAIASFFSSGLDALIFNAKFLIRKKQ